MVALSAGFLNMSAPAPAGPHGFPEPPPAPRQATRDTEDLSSDDWEVAETPPLAQVEPAPESVDDFAEELPPSLPPPSLDDELPSSTGTPSLRSLTHHDQPGGRRDVDDFFANMSAATPGTAHAGAPTIDVSGLSTARGAQAEPDLDLSAFDVPLTGKQTLPLFGLSDDSPPILRPPSVDKPIAPSPPDASLRAVSLDRSHAEPSRDSVRTRRNVVAPATASVPPPAPGRRRSGVAVPVLLLLAGAAAFLIWKRSSVAASEGLVHANESATAAQAPATQAPAVATDSQMAGEPAPVTAGSAVAAIDELALETTPTKAVAKVAGDAKTTAGSVKPHEPPADSPKPAAPAEATVAVPKEEAKTAPVAAVGPSEPAGPFDRDAAAAALTSGAATASGCRKDGDPSGVASVVITFAPSGRVTSANVSGPPFAGTPTGGCIAAALRKAKVPPFEGDRVTVSKTIVIQ